MSRLLSEGFNGVFILPVKSNCGMGNSFSHCVSHNTLKQPLNYSSFGGGPSTRFETIRN